MDDSAKIVAAFLEDPSAALGPADLIDKTGIERTTLYRRLKELGAEQILTVEGAGRTTKYLLNPLADAYLQWDLSRPPAERSRVVYQPELLANYVPNETRFLSPEQIANMHAAAGVGEPEIAPETYRRVLNSLLIDLTYASSRLENVNITWLDTKALVEFGEKPDGLTSQELTIVLNHKKAIQYMADNRLEFNRRDIFDVHTLLMTGLFQESGVEGRIRTKIVVFDSSKYVPLANPQQISEEFDTVMEKAQQIVEPFERSLFSMLFLSYLQPFQDGNKRTGRLAANLPLLAANLPPFSFADMSRKEYMFGLLAFYERGRSDFLAKAFADSYCKTAVRYKELMDLVQTGGILSTLVVDNAPESTAREATDEDGAETPIAPAPI